MRTIFLQNKHAREKALAHAVRTGMSAHGDKLQVIPYDDNAREMDCDAIAVVGVKCREWVEHCRATGKRFLYFDKGYHYPKEKATLGQPLIVNCWRVSVDETQPLRFLETAECDEGRWAKFKLWPQPWREETPDGHIVIAGSSPKYHLFNGLAEPTTYYQGIVEELRQHTDRPIWYRPKPSWRQSEPLEGAEFVPAGEFENLCQGAHAIVTHGSNASLIAMLMGIPSVILGNGVMRPISSTSVSQIEDLYLATDAERRRLLANLAWSQWTLAEWVNGRAWVHVKRTFLQ